MPGFSCRIIHEPGPYCDNRAALFFGIDMTEGGMIASRFMILLSSKHLIFNVNLRD